MIFTFKMFDIPVRTVPLTDSESSNCLRNQLSENRFMKNTYFDHRYLNFATQNYDAFKKPLIWFFYRTTIFHKQMIKIIIKFISNLK
jgi:hypothetical protein